MTCALDRVGVVLTFALASLWPDFARGDAQNKAAAESLYRDALALMEKGEYQPACPKLVESQRLDPAVGTLLYLGECYEKVGLTASAWVTFTSAIDAAKRAEQTNREQIASERAAQLEERVSHLTIVVPPEARVPGLQIKRDGAMVGEAAWGIGMPLDPGEHTIEAAAPGRLPWSKKVNIQAATRADLTEFLPLLVESEPAIKRGSLITANGPPPLDSGTPSQSGKIQRIAGVALGGVGAIGLAVGAVFGLRAKSKENDSEAHCWPNDNSRCTPEGVELIDQAGNAATVANIGLIGGALAIAGGTVLYFTAPKNARATAATQTLTLRFIPEVAPTRNCLILQGKF